MHVDRPTRDRFDALFAGDLATEIRDEFDERVAFGLPVADASAAVIEQYGGLLRDPSDGPIVLIVLAALQLKNQGLQPAVRDAALELLEAGTDAFAAASDPSRRGELRDLLGALEDELAAHREAQE